MSALIIIDLGMASSNATGLSPLDIRLRINSCRADAAPWAVSDPTYNNTNLVGLTLSPWQHLIPLAITLNSCRADPPPPWAVSDPTYNNT